MIKFRIKAHDEEYFILQQKGWFFWNTIYRYIPYGFRSVMLFSTKTEAKRHANTIVKTKRRHNNTVEEFSA